MYDKRKYQFTNKVEHEQIAAFIKLFKMAPTHNLTEHFFAKATDAIDYGLVFLTEDGDICRDIPGSIFQYAVDFYGVDSRRLNNTFYKSFGTVVQATPSELIFDQLLHYFSTYGLEASCNKVYNLETSDIKVPLYVPYQALDLPETDVSKNQKITIIQLASVTRCIERLNEYLKNLVTPSRELVNYIKTVLPLATLEDEEIKSFEIQVIRYQMNNTIPTNPVSLLRYLVYVTTGETLIIKNKYMRERIKGSALSSGNTAYEILSQANKEDLASIFLRYKPIFLAFKSHNKCAPIINHIRRLAVVHHKPLPNETLQNFLQLTDEKARERILKNASNRELVKLANSIANKAAIEEDTPGVYPIRNGRTFVKNNAIKMDITEEQFKNMFSSLTEILDALEERLRPVLTGKTFYLPANIEYTVPTSEKQMIGNIPFGTQIVNTPEDGVTIGVHWFDQGGRTDLDLHMNSATRHFGWNASYRDGAETIYTGDMTAAPQPLGAAEAFWLSPQNEVYLLDVYKFSGANAAEFKMFMTSENLNEEGYGRGYSRQNKQYTFDQNASLFPPIPLKMQPDSPSQTLGIFVNGNFYFYGGSIGSGVVPSANYGDFLKGLVAQLTSKLFISELLDGCGANIITSVEGLDSEQLQEVISLSPEDLTVDTLFNIVDGTI